MGAQLSTQAPTAVVSIDAYVAELVDFSYIGDLGRARFLKTVKTLHREGEAVVKVFIKPTLRFDLTPIRRLFEDYNAVLENVPNAIGFARIIENDRAGYLIRQYIKHNLYDRISTRPFLENIEKLWIMFQLLRVLKDTHKHNIFHGDIKAENVLVTSWKWVYLSDWAPYKPVTLPETDSTDFLFYFNTSGRRFCYVAPERFTASIGEGPKNLDAAMDIYSLGCVFAELFMDGKPLFTLADSFKYKRGEYEPVLTGIEGPMLELLRSMINIDPNQRLSAGEYLDKYKSVLFPDYFWNIYDLIVSYSRSVANNSSSTSMVQHIYDNFDNIIDILSLDIGPEATPTETILPVLVNTESHCWLPRRQPPEKLRDGALLILAIVCSQLGSTATVHTRLLACDMILGISEFTSDDIKLNRSLPYLMVLLKDQNEDVQVAAISTVSQLLSTTAELPDLNEKLFSDYLFPRFKSSVLSSNSSTRVRAAYASCLPCLAELAYSLMPVGVPPSAPKPYDEAVHTHIVNHVRYLLTDQSSLVRRAVLTHFDTLCAPMGRKNTNDIFLSHTVTYLSDKDVQVHKDFFTSISRIGPIIGPASLEQYVIPLMLQSLVDTHEDVVSTVINSLGSLIDLGLIRPKILWTILSTMVKFFIHPNNYIRTAVFVLFSVSAKWFTSAQIHCLLKPMLEQVLRGEISEFKDHKSYISAVKPPISVAVYTLTLSWATDSQNSTFWNPTQVNGSGSEYAHQHTTISFSEEDKRWMERLRDVGFNNEDLWQLLIYKDYMRQLSRSKKTQIDEKTFEVKAMPHTWTESEIPAGLEHYISRKAFSMGKPDPPDHNIDSDVSNSTMNRLQKHLLSLKVSDNALDSDAALKEEPRFSGTLVTSAKAHRGAVIALAVCDNQQFFITGADDKLIKIWDTRSICKGSPRPVVSHEFESEVTSICFLRERTSFFVSTANGRIEFMDIRVTKTETRVQYDNLSSVQTLQLSSGYAISLKHVENNLYVLRSDCVVEVFDMVTLKSQEMKNPVEHGPPSCWCFDRENCWLAIGTLHGVIDVWDLRFNLLVQSWGIGDLHPITAMSLHPHASSRWISLGGGFDNACISTWDVQNTECRELLVPINSDAAEPLPHLEPLLGAELAEKLVMRSLKASFDKNKAITALYSEGHLAGKFQFLISGGSDRILRYWDLKSPQKCCVISGISSDHAELTYTSHIGASVRTTYEKPGAAKFKPNRRARMSMIQTEESDIGRNHRGAITQVGVLAYQRTMVVSVDEVGYVKVYL